MCDVGLADGGVRVCRCVPAACSRPAGGGDSLGSSSDGGFEPDWENFGETENVDADEDHGRRDAPEDFAAQYMLVRVRSGATPLWGWAPLDDEGCTGIFRTGASTIALDWVTWAVNDDDDHIVALDCDNEEHDCELFGRSVMLDVQTGVMDVEWSVDDLDILAEEQPAVSMLWAMTFSEGRQSYYDGMVIYGAHRDPTVTLGSAVTNTFVANRPTINMHSGAHTRKFVIAHEYGHVQTLYPLLPVWANVEPFVDFCSPDTCEKPSANTNHSLYSSEWQAAAAIEGFAHFYSITVWNDAPGDGVLARADTLPWKIKAYKDTDTYTNDAGTFTSFLQSRVAGPCTMQEDLPCANCSCIDSVWVGCNCSAIASERDWMFYLWDLLGGSPALDLDFVMMLLSDSYLDDDSWPAAQDPDWWPEFESVAKAQLGTMAEQDRISDEAALRGIDQ